eukprot:4955851-Prymnesium_polylepis.1
MLLAEALRPLRKLGARPLKLVVAVALLVVRQGWPATRYEERTTLANLFFRQCALQVVHPHLRPSHAALDRLAAVSYTHLRAHETLMNL